MQINTNTIVSVTEANQNFSRVTRIAEKNGQAVIFKNNRPKFLLIDMESSPVHALSMHRSDIRRRSPSPSLSSV